MMDCVKCSVHYRRLRRPQTIIHRNPILFIFLIPPPRSVCLGSGKLGMLSATARVDMLLLDAKAPNFLGESLGSNDDNNSVYWMRRRR
ncbi:hypothetical protein Bca4012_028052 [Brassica carinata]